MFNIKLITIDKIKKEFFLEAANEYLKRLNPFARIEITELKPESFSASNKEKAKQIEGEKIEAVLEKNNSKNIFLLDENGKDFTSMEFAKFLSKNEELVLVIGGALGFSEKLKNKYSRVSLSQMTMPHELARVVLLEQIYRAVTILKNKNYHY